MNAKNIVYLYGEDWYRSQEVLKSIISKFQSSNQGNLNQSVLWADELVGSRLSNLVNTSSLFNSKQLIIIKDPISRGSKDFHESLAKLLPNLNQDTILILHELSKPDGRLQIGNLLKKSAGVSKYFEQLKPAQINLYLQAYAKKNNYIIEADVPDQLMMRLGNDLGQLVGELDRLAYFDSNHIITSQNVQKITPSLVVESIFGLSDELAKCNLGSTLTELENQFNAGVVPQLILGTISSLIRNLALISEGIQHNLAPRAIAGESGIHPYVTAKLYSRAKSIDSETAKHCYNILNQCDRNIKTGIIESGLALSLCVSGLIKIMRVTS